MKSILIIGATLMAGAGIYGFVDYKKKNHSVAFKTLYKEEKPVQRQPTPEFATPPITVTPMEKQEPIVENKKAIKQVKRKPKKFRPKSFSRAIIGDEVLDEVPIKAATAPPTKEL
jgi:hypothetical protein